MRDDGLISVQQRWIIIPPEFTWISTENQRLPMSKSTQQLLVQKWPFCFQIYDNAVFSHVKWNYLMESRPGKFCVKTMYEYIAKVNHPRQILD